MFISCHGSLKHNDPFAASPTSASYSLPGCVTQGGPQALFCKVRLLCCVSLLDGHICQCIAMFAVPCSLYVPKARKDQGDGVRAEPEPCGPCPGAPRDGKRMSPLSCCLSLYYTASPEMVLMIPFIACCTTLCIPRQQLCGAETLRWHSHTPRIM